MDKPKAGTIGARRCANGVMTLFFAYATYVQMNDPDSWFWMSLYGFASSSCLAAAVLDQAALTRVLFGVLVLVSGVNLAQQRSANGGLEFNPKTEPGREASGTTIVLAWALQNLLLVSAPPIVTYSIAALALAIAASVYTIPKFYLSPDDTVEHCVGLGFPAGKA